MSSCKIDPDLRNHHLLPHESYDTDPPSLPEGRYYLVDISGPVAQYMNLPSSVRMCGIDGSMTYDDESMLDIELESIVPCLDGDATAPRALHEHVEDLLDDGVDQLKFLMREAGVDTDKRTVLNTAEQLEHAKAINQLGEQIHQIFREHKLYTESGRLMGEHCTILQGGVLVLRET